MVFSKQQLHIIRKEYSNRGNLINLKNDLEQFENWLKIDDLFLHFNDNPSQQLEIFKDFQRERENISKNDIKDWIIWATRNPKDAEKYFPIWTDILIKSVQRTPSYKTANVIQKLPENLNKWAIELNETKGVSRTKRISEVVSFLHHILNEGDFKSEIEKNALLSIKDELEEQLQIWNELLNDSKGYNSIELEVNPYPNIFVGNSSKPFKLFSKYIKGYMVDPFIDFSFIFQQMKSDKYIINIKHISFARWAYANNFINKKLLSEIEVKGNLRSLKKSTSANRLNNYNNLIEEIFN